MDFAAKQQMDMGNNQDMETVASMALSGLGAEAQGQAVAVLFLKHVQDQGNALMRFMKEVFDLNLQGRKAFRVYLQHQLKEQREYVKSHEGKKDHELLKRSLASATTRQSEAVTMSKAFDAGFNPLWEKDSTGKWVAKEGKVYLTYHSLVGFARGFLQSNAAGPTQKRGRKEKSKIQKAEEYLLKQEFTKAEWQAIKAWIESGHEAPKTEE